MPGAKVQAFPGPGEADPELRLNHDDSRLSRNRWSRATSARWARVGDGMFAASISTASALE